VQATLVRACKNNELKQAKSAIDKGANVALPDDSDVENMPMHIAACFGATHVICLLHEHGAELEPKNAKKRTPLQIAERVGEQGSISVLTALIEGKPVTLDGDADDDADDAEPATADPPPPTADAQPSTDAEPITEAMGKLSTEAEVAGTALPATAVD